MAFRLPPLSSLRVFEAAARHNSFRKAADELNLTASAVSHGIQTLENWLGVELFHRGSRGLRLTGAGEIYAPLVNQALSVLAKATDRIPGRKATGTLAVSSAPTFATKFLLPRLRGFIGEFPDMRVTVDTSQRLVDLALDDIDIAIRFSPVKKPASNWTLLAAETMIPVCSPELKARFPGSSDADLLTRLPLIHLTHVSTDWTHWFEASGMEIPPSIHGGLRVDTIQMGYDAAIQGLGIVLGRHPLIDEDIASGRLVPLAASAIPSGSSYWLVTPETDFQKPEVKLFRNWLLAEFGAGPAPRRAARPSQSRPSPPRPSPPRSSPPRSSPRNGGRLLRG